MQLIARNLNNISIKGIFPDVKVRSECFPTMYHLSILMSLFPMQLKNLSIKNIELKK